MNGLVLAITGAVGRASEDERLLGEGKEGGRQHVRKCTGTQWVQRWLPIPV